jgi:hypothetical protein
MPAGNGALAETGKIGGTFTRAHEPTEGDRRASAELRATLEAMGADSAATTEVE